MEIEINVLSDLGGMNKKTIKLSINSIVLKLSNYLDLTTLESITIPSEFGADIINFQREHGLLEGYTKHDSGYVGGKTLSYMINGNFKQTVFLNQKVFEDHAVRFCIVNHELCHVHDDYMQFKMGVKPKLEKNSQQEGVLKEAFLSWAGSVWAEYIATRLSAKQAAIEDGDNSLYNSEFIAGDLQLFSEFLVTTEKEISSQTNVSRTSGDWSKLFDVARGSVNQLVGAAGKVYGHIHAIEEFNSEGGKQLRENIYEMCIKQSSFKNIWPELEPALQTLYDNYPNWNGSEELSELAEIVQITWNTLGVYTNELESGRIWVGPLRP